MKMNSTHITTFPEIHTDSFSAADFTALVKDITLFGWYTGFWFLLAWIVVMSLLG